MPLHNSSSCGSCCSLLLSTAWATSCPSHAWYTRPRAPSPTSSHTGGLQHSTVQATAAAAEAEHVMIGPAMHGTAAHVRLAPPAATREDCRCSRQQQQEEQKAVNCMLGAAVSATCCECTGVQVRKEMPSVISTRCTLTVASCMALWNWRCETTSHLSRLPAVQLPASGTEPCYVLGGSGWLTCLACCLSTFQQAGLNPAACMSYWHEVYTRLLTSCSARCVTLSHLSACLLPVHLPASGTEPCCVQVSSA
jgi:hypothetical protein